MIDKTELEQLMFPTLTTIYNILQHTAIQTPELTSAVDKCLTELFNIGEKLEKIANALEVPIEKLYETDNK